MTKQQIETMPAGAEMNALIAEHVCGWFWYWWLAPNGDKLRVLHPPNHKIFGDWTLWTPDSGECRIVPGHTLPDYSGDIAAAWLVVAELKKLGLRVSLYQEWNNKFVVVFGTSFEPNTNKPGCAIEIELAICRAALIAKLSESEVAA